MSGPVIVTGQQVGLLGGPLYTTYKILGAVTLARQLDGEAVFWMETNDADFNEISRMTILDRERRLWTTTWQRDTGGAPVGLVTIDDTLPDLIRACFDVLPATEFTPGLMELALAAYRPGRTLAEASRELFRSLFGPFGVRVFDPSDPSFLQAVRPILEKECRDTPPGHQCAAFARINGRREALFRTDTGFALRDGTPVGLDDVLLQPSRDTRPVCQDAFFNTHTYVAGPAEAAYLAELGPLYHRHGITPARVQRRMQVTFMEPRIRRLLERNGWAPESLLAAEPADLRRDILASGGFSPEWSARVEQAKERFMEELAALSMLDPGLRKTLDRAVRDALGRRRAAARKRTEDRLADLDEVFRVLKPDGKPQERVYNAFMFMNRFGGTEWLQWLLDRHRFEPVILEWTHA